jgi:ABC-type transport system involved in multi-copper enzyme maturation permease subunit
MAILARRKSMYWSRWVTAVVALLVMLWLLVVSAARVSFAELGKSIFFILSSLCFTFATLIGMHATADCLSEEKREGTLGLLFLTDLRSFDVIGGKLAASSLQAAMALIGVIPMISLALLLGGVTLQQFGEVALVLGNTLFLSLALGVFVSSLSRNERKAMVGTFVALFVITLGPWILSYLFRQYLGFPEKLLAASPLYNFAMIHSNPMVRPPPGTGYFWESLIGLHFFAWALLGVSAWILPRSVNEVPSRRFQRIRQFADNFVYGRREARKAHRAELLDRNAFLWLASRERVKARYAWGILAFFAGLYLWIALQFQDMLFDLAICGAVMFLTHLVFKIWAASEVCSRLIQDRRSGALELLLSTPLSVRQIAEGQSLALRRLFLKPIALLVLVEVFLLYKGWNAPRQMTGSAPRLLLYVAIISTFLVDLWALKWVGLWLSLTGKSMERVLIATISRVLFLPWLVYATAAGFFGAKVVLMDNRMDAGSAIFGWGLLSILISVTLGWGARQNFLTQFRELAARRFDSVPEPEPAPAVSKQKALVRRRTGTAILEAFRRRPVASSLVLLLLAIILGVLARSEYWSFRLKREVAAIDAQGFPTSMRQAVSYSPAPASDEDAFVMLRNGGMMNWRGGPPMMRVARGSTPEAIQQAKFAQATNLLSANQAQLVALWRLPQYQRAYIDPLAADLWQQHANHVSYAAIVEADIIVTLNQPGPIPVDRVERSIRALLAHARLLRRQPVGFAQQCAGEALRRLASALEEVLKRDLLDEPVLQILINDAFSVDDPEALTRTLAVQRALFIEPPPDLFGGGVFLGTPASSSLQATLMKLMNNLGTRDKTLVEVLESYEQAIRLAKTPYPRPLDYQLFFDHGRMMRLQAIRRMGPNVPFSYIPDAFWNDAGFTAALHLIQTALAMERHQRRHQRLPAELAALVPDFLPAVPIDPHTGKPLSMLRTSDATLIYSVGMDLEDNTANRPTGKRRTGSDDVFTFR